LRFGSEIDMLNVTELLGVLVPFAGVGAMKLVKGIASAIKALRRNITIVMTL
jgi:hypothetical protein